MRGIEAHVADVEADDLENGRDDDDDDDDDKQFEC